MLARTFAFAVAAVAACAACTKTAAAPKPAPTPEVTGLAAGPSTAEAVIAIDVARIADSPIVGRAIDQLMMRDADLAARWQRLQGSCKIDLAKQIKHVMLALGRKTGETGSGPVLMVATGSVAETDLVACVRAMVGDGHGELTVSTAGGRTLYEAKDGNRTMFFAYGRPDTIVLGSNQMWVTDALGTGKKALDNPELEAWIDLADQHAPAWGVGRLDDSVRKGLVHATAGAVTAGPIAIVASLDASAGAKVDVGAVMASPTDANALESFAKQQLGLLGYRGASQSGLGKLVDKVTHIATLVAVVHFKVDLGIDEVNQLLSVLDGGGAPPQDAGP